MAPFVLLSLLAAAPTIALSGESSCAPREVLRQELSAAGVVFGAEGEVLLWLERDGRLSLAKEGRVVLSRSLGSGSCDELGRAAAVVVVRWVQELMHPVAPLKIEVKKFSLSLRERVGVRAEPAAVPTEPIQQPQPEPEPVVAEPAPEVIVDAGVADAGTDTELPLTPTLSPLRRERELPLEILAGGGLTVPGAPQVAPVISLDLALLIADHFRVDLAGLFDFGGTVPVLDEARLIRGELTTRGGAIIPGGAYCFTEPVRICLGAFAGLRIIEGTSSGTFVFNDDTTHVSAFVFGPNAQVALIRGPFFLALDLSLFITPTPPSFSVQGLPTTLPLPALQGLFRLSVGFGNSP